MNQIPNIEEEAKCRRCGMSLRDCPKTRWTNPLCVVNGVEWDEHVIGISTLHQQLQKAQVEAYTKGSEDGYKLAVNDLTELDIDHSELNQDKK